MIIKKYNFTEQEVEILKSFGVEKDNDSNHFKVRDSDTLFKFTFVINEYQQNIEVIEFNFKIFEGLPLYSSKVQHFVKAIYYTALCKSEDLKSRENQRHAYISVFMQNISCYAPQANQFDPENNVVHNRNTHSQSLDYALFSTLIIMFSGTVFSLFTSDAQSFYKALDGSFSCSLLLLAYGFATGR